MLISAVWHLLVSRSTKSWHRRWSWGHSLYQTLSGGLNSIVKLCKHTLTVVTPLGWHVLVNLTWYPKPYSINSKCTNECLCKNFNHLLGDDLNIWNPSFHNHKCLQAGTYTTGATTWQMYMNSLVTSKRQANSWSCPNVTAEHYNIRNIPYFILTDRAHFMYTYKNQTAYS